ncbi:unnamed protein product [Vitrella brassicaformis CCMP3155]|uniref:Anaphase-promoting complex subunit 4 WD40 domain-containing protein n=1 Tax=Vitrella brassicaformis (strain CCMP3155) TaxID=1169540 RepID=A0A0G4ENR0_VITBC|nr:unnamed protein product [Vitrella brassicaformis CCMP3155]|mmetsp:Transcript_38159/g.95552  ORF Transcript_38159/g.95552 Transcript_38159/m.95552 type:complete len:365 (-) Transcript_38159:73-1167(-)|eukprot:CEL98498.1 unnamed protein product [Vitrella brassicaformis CCMP3155]
MFGGGLGGASAVNYNTNGDYEVPQCPTDGISEVAWAKGRNILACASWDKSVRIWEVTAQQTFGAAGGYTAAPKVSYNHESPALTCEFSHDMQYLWSAGCDKKIKVCNLGAAGNPTQDCGTHDAPIRHIKWCQELNMLISGGWDRTLKFWDFRQGQQATTLQLPERCYAMDLKYPVLVVGTADLHVLIYNLQNIQQTGAPVKTVTSNLKMQTRCVSIFTDKTGWATGSVEGRVYIAYIDESQSGKSFAFKCHRVDRGHNESDIYPVNSIDFHPQFGTFATTGSDGTFVFWDKDNKQRLKQFKPVNIAIPCARFNYDGSIFAYACSYDWHKGHDGALSTNPNKILLHRVTEDEIKNKKPQGGGGRR